MIVLYHDEDFEDCVTIYLDAFTAPPLCYHFITKENAKRYIKDLTLAPSFLGYVYKIDTVPMAFIFGKLDNYFPGSMFEVYELAVASAFHRSGIGTHFLELFEAKLAGYGVEAISLHTSRSLPAYNFYSKNGYEEMSESVTLTKWLK